MKRKKLLTLLAVLTAVVLAVGTAGADLIGFWNFDDGYATTGPGGIKDLATDDGSHDGTLTGGTFSTDVPAVLGGGRSLDLTAGDYYVKIDTFLGGAADADFDALGALSVSVWVKGWPDNWEPFVSKRGESNQGWQVRRRTNANDPTFTLRGTSATDDPSSSQAVGPNTGWTHLVGTYDGAVRKLYVNGVETMSIADTGTIAAAATSLVCFGARDNAGTMQTFARVKLDDIGIWNNALTAQEVQDLANGIPPVSMVGAEIVYPKYGEVVPPGDVTLEWINYADPNGVTVDVAWGTDPNRYTGNYTQVVTAGENVTTATITPPGPGVYYWYVDTTIGGTDPCTAEGRVYMFTNDGPIVSVNAGADMVTWAGEPVGLIADVNDDGGSALTYSWTTGTLPGGVTAVFDPSADVADTAVTFTRAPYTTANVANPGFEADVIADGTQTTTVPTGWTKSGFGGYWNPDNTGGGASGFGGVVPEGENCLWVNNGVSASQVLSETFQEGATYTLSVDVGFNATYGAGARYSVQLLAGGTVIAEDDNGLIIPLDTFVTSTVTYTYDAVADANKVGLPLEIKLACTSTEAPNSDAEFDNVVLTTDTPFPVTDFSSIDVTLTVTDETNPAVSDTMTIEVYDDECQAARTGKNYNYVTDYDTNCLINTEDLAVMALAWLNDSSATDFVRAEPGPALAGQLGVLDVTGINPATGQQWKEGDQYRLAFVTNVTRDATDPDIATYNAFVQAAAESAGLGGATWKCVAATFGTGPSNSGYDANRDTNVGRLPVELPTYLIDGKTKLWNQFLTGSPLNTYSLTEIGSQYLGTVATGAGRVLGDPGQTNIEDGNSSRTDGTAWWRIYNHAKTAQSHFYAVSEPLTVIVPVVDAGDKISTWLGQPFTMAPTVGDQTDPGAEFTYEWTTDAPEWLNVTISDPAIEAPTVTVERVVPYWWEIAIDDSSFENYVMTPDGQMKWLYSNQTHWRFADPDGTAYLGNTDGKGYWGQLFLWNPKAGLTIASWNRAGMDGIVPDGDNCVIVGSILRSGDVGPIPASQYNGGLAKLLVTDTENGDKNVYPTYDPGYSYELSVNIGHDGLSFWRQYGYRVELLAGGENVRSSDQYTDKVVGGTVIGSVESTDPIDPNTWVQVTIPVGPNPANADLAGEPLQIRITSLKHPTDPNTFYVMVDDVVLKTDAPPALVPLTMTLSATKVGEPNSISDNVTVDLYETPCELVKAVDPASMDATDHNIDCITNLMDFAILTEDWLKDYALKAAETK